MRPNFDVQPSGLRRIAPNLLAAFLLPLIAIPAHAQLDPNPALEYGTKPYGAFQGGAIDSISMTNGSLNLHIPLVSYPQRGGKLQVNFYVKYVNNNYLYTPGTVPGCTTAPYTCGYGTTVNGPLMEITTNLGLTAFVSGVIPPYNGPYATIKTADDSEHEMGAASNGWRTIDATGFLCLSNCGIIIDRAGIRYSTSSTGGVATKIEDTNGNFITATISGSTGLTTYQDTLGRTMPLPPVLGYSGGTNFGNTSDFSGCTGALPTLTAYLWTLPGYQGGQMVYKICYADVYFGETTCLKMNGKITCGVTLQHSALIQSIVLPNNTAWTFQYDSADPKVSGSSATGNLLQIHFPTGGYIKYT